MVQLIVIIVLVPDTTIMIMQLLQEQIQTVFITRFTEQKPVLIMVLLR